MALPLITADIKRWSVFPAAAAAAAAEGKYRPSRLRLSLYFIRLSRRDDFCFSSVVAANGGMESEERGDGWEGEDRLKHLGGFIAIWENMLKNLKL